ncbi:unnamed protein product [Merluccius merluccius]
MAIRPTFCCRDAALNEYEIRASGARLASFVLQAVDLIWGFTLPTRDVDVDGVQHDVSPHGTGWFGV